MPINTQYPIIDILGSTRAERLGRFASKGLSSPITPDTENPWIFSSFMVTVAGNVVVEDRAYNTMLFPACQPGRQYWAIGIKIVASGTTATGIYVYGGV